jgi:3-oxoacyl-[acyl-carrier-protein] synthase-1
MAFDRTLAPTLVGVERAAALAAHALDEIAAAVGPPLRSLRVRVALSLPEPLAARGDRGVSLARAMRDVLRESVGSTDTLVSARGAAGLAYVLPDALAALARAEVDAVVAGGVHTDYDPLVVAALAAEGRLYTHANPDSVLPGEGAAFVLFVRDDLLARLGLRPLARVLSVAAETSPFSLSTEGRAFESTALTSVLREATAPLPDEIRIGWAVTDTGFEHARVRELYSAVTRAHARFGPPLVIDSPSQRLGHLGAAALGFELGFMALAMDRGFAPAPFGLALAASDGGERGAILLASP